MNLVLRMPVLLMRTGLEDCFDLHYSQADNQAFEP